MFTCVIGLKPPGNVLGTAAAAKHVPQIRSKLVRTLKRGKVAALFMHRLEDNWT